MYITRIIKYVGISIDTIFQAKVTNFEGGVRVPAIVFSPLLQNRSRVSEKYIHITDWFPTLYKLAGGELKDIQNLKLDGFDQWSTISNDSKSKRNSMFLNIDEVFKWEGAIMGKYKLIKGEEIDSTLLNFMIIFNVSSSFPQETIRLLVIMLEMETSILPLIM